MVSLILVGTSLVLLLFGVAIAVNLSGLAQSVTMLVVGPPAMDSAGPAPGTNRYWSLLPFAYGSAVLLSVVLKPSGRLGPILELLAVVAYFGVTIRLAWIYAPPAERARGPLFLARRPSVIPAAAFIGLSAILVVVLGVVKRLAQ